MSHTASTRIPVCRILATVLFAFGLGIKSMAGEAAPGDVGPVLAEYLKIQAALASDSTTGTSDAARSLAKLASADNAMPPEIAAAATKVADATDLEATREAFKVLSKSLSRHLSTKKIQTGRYYQIYCSMAKAGWIQADKAVKNPYHGKSMLSCGEVMGTY